jgi:transposase
MDMGKNTLHMIGLDSRGAIVLREKVSRGRITSRLANLPSCLIGIEAGLATHYVARELAALGHDVKQVPPTYAKPFRQAHKNDFRDAYSVAEAVQRPTTRFVPAKTDEQLDLQALHAQTFSHHGWYASSRILPVTGGSSMRELNP